jgi:cellulose synthase/poly-beta-1,6-N-acetylglucosamine synthase-like glycosyltransferase
MAFPWSIVSQLNFATASIVEDICLGLDCAAVRQAPLFCPEAGFKSAMPSSAEAQAIQRTRWETGHLNMIARHIPFVILQSIITRNRDLLVLACDLSVPPLAFLALMLVTVGIVSTLLALAGGTSLAFALFASAAIIFAMTIMAVWWKIGRKVMSPREIFAAAIYAVSKIAHYGRIVAGQQVGWIRTKRD